MNENLVLFVINFKITDRDLTKNSYRFWLVYQDTLWTRVGRNSRLDVFNSALFCVKGEVHVALSIS